MRTIGDVTRSMDLCRINDEFSSTRGAIPAGQTCCCVPGLPMRAYYSEQLSQRSPTSIGTGVAQTDKDGSTPIAEEDHPVLPQIDGDACCDCETNLPRRRRACDLTLDPPRRGFRAGRQAVGEAGGYMASRSARRRSRDEAGSLRAKLLSPIRTNYISSAMHRPAVRRPC